MLHQHFSKPHSIKWSVYIKYIIKQSQINIVPVWILGNRLITEAWGKIMCEKNEVNEYDAFLPSGLSV